MAARLSVEPKEVLITCPPYHQVASNGTGSQQKQVSSLHTNFSKAVFFPRPFCAIFF